MTPGQNIKTRREALGLHQQHIADELGVSREAVSNWERDVNIPRGRRLAKLAARLQCTVDDIVPQAKGAKVPRKRGDGFIEQYFGLEPGDKRLAQEFVKRLHSGQPKAPAAAKKIAKKGR